MKEIKLIANYKRAKTIKEFEAGLDTFFIDTPYPDELRPKKVWTEKIIEFPALDRGNTIRIPNLSRCLGIIILTEPRTDSLSQISRLYSFHIPPYSLFQRMITQLWEYHLREINEAMRIRRVFVGGGRVDDETNIVLFQNSSAGFSMSIPEIISEPIEIIQFVPGEDVINTNMYATGRKVIAIQETKKGNKMAGERYREIGIKTS